MSLWSSNGGVNIWHTNLVWYSHYYSPSFSKLFVKFLCCYNFKSNKKLCSWKNQRSNSQLFVDLLFIYISKKKNRTKTTLIKISNCWQTGKTKKKNAEGTHTQLHTEANIWRPHQTRVLDINEWIIKRMKRWNDRKQGLSKHNTKSVKKRNNAK